MEFGGTDSGVGADKGRVNFGRAIVLRLFFVRLCRHLIGRGPHCSLFGEGLSSDGCGGVALSAVCQPCAHAHMHTCAGGARVASSFSWFSATRSRRLSEGSTLLSIMPRSSNWLSWSKQLRKEMPARCGMSLTVKTPFCIRAAMMRPVGESKSAGRPPLSAILTRNRAARIGGRRFIGHLIFSSK